MLVSITDVLLQESLTQYDFFAGDIKEAARRNAAFFAVAPEVLVGEKTVAYFASEEVSEEPSRIKAHAGFSNSDIFIYKEDYSQYVPRGHYTRSETLRKHLKAMMRYGKKAFLLKGSGLVPEPRGR